MPVTLAVTESLAVTVWVPADFSVAEKVPTPLVKVEFPGSVACVSVLVNLTVPT